MFLRNQVTQKPLVNEGIIFFSSCLFTKSVNSYLYIFIFVSSPLIMWLSDAYYLNMFEY